MSSSAVLLASTEAAASIACEILTFDVGAERYALALDAIQEIRGFEKPTRLPGAQPYSLGVIQLRGMAVPLVDMRVLLGASAAEVTATTAVIIVRAEGRIAGLVVDAVCDVLALAEGQLRRSPCSTSAAARESILGLAQVNDRMVIVIRAQPYLAMTSALN